MSGRWEGPEGPKEFALWWRHNYTEWPTEGHVRSETGCNLADALYGLGSARRALAMEIAEGYLGRQGRYPSVKRLAHDTECAELCAEEVLRDLMRKRGQAGGRPRAGAPRLTR